MKKTIATLLLMISASTFAQTQFFPSPKFQTECDQLVKNRVESADWHKYEEDYNKANLLGYQIIDHKRLNNSGNYLVVRRYIVRAGYDVNLDSSSNSTYAVYVVYKQGDWDFSCKINKIEEIRQR